MLTNIRPILFKNAVNIIWQMENSKIMRKSNFKQVNWCKLELKQVPGMKSKLWLSKNVYFRNYYIIVILSFSLVIHCIVNFIWIQCVIFDLFFVWTDAFDYSAFEFFAKFILIGTHGAP